MSPTSCARGARSRRYGRRRSASRSTSRARSRSRTGTGCSATTGSYATSPAWRPSCASWPATSPRCRTRARPVDSALLFALAAAQWRAGAPLADGLAHAIRTVTPLAAGRYNLLAADGASLAATTWQDTLFVRRLEDEGVVLASEPYDDEPGWEEVPDRSLVTAGPAGVVIMPL